MTYARKLLLTSNSTTNTTPPQFSPSPSQSSEAAVALESEFAVLLAALLCAIICVLGLVVVARCAWLRRGADGRRFGFSSGNRLANKGLKKKVLQALPKYTHNSDAAATMEEAVVVEDCAICLAEYVDGDQIRVLPQCGHRFHVECIDMWLGSHSSCPSCRQILVVNRCRKCGEVSSSGSGDGRGGGGGGGGCGVDKLSPISGASTSTPTFSV